MHKNYFLFEKQISELKPLILKKRISKIFSYRKNEVVFEFEDDISYFLMISIDINFPYIFIKPAYRIRLHKFNLFDYLIDEVIRDISIISHDKFVIIKLKNYTISIIFYGKQPNIIIKNNSDKIINYFKDKGKFTDTPGGELLDFRTIIKENLIDLTKKERRQKLSFFLKRHFAAFNNLIIKEILVRAQLDREIELSSLSNEDYTALINSFERIAAEINNNKNYIYRESVKINRISPFQLKHLEKDQEIEKNVFYSVNQAWIRFVSEKIEQKKYDHLYHRCYQALKKRQQYLKQSLESIKQIEDIKKRKKLAEIKGNLLLTFKNQINTRNSEVELENIFSDNLEKITIKLNPAKSVVENANQYFNKFKNIDKAKLLLDIKRNTYESELKNVKKLTASLDKNYEISRLNKIYNELIGMKMIQGVESKRESPTAIRYSFNRLILDNEWDVYIGKSGENNDLLTFTYANKWDIWLHAQGVPGSHVILKVPKRDFHPPHKIIEQAAQLAAANSRAKHSATVPVIYTHVRHVHRIRKSPPGTVSTKNEKVLFVKPLKLN